MNTRNLLFSIFMVQLCCLLLSTITWSATSVPSPPPGLPSATKAEPAPNPEINLTIGKPNYAANGVQYVTSRSLLTLAPKTPLSVNERIEYRVDDASTWKNYKQPFSLSLYTEGPHKLTYRLTGQDGMEGPEKTVSITIDDGSPMTEIVLSEPFRTIRPGEYVAAPTTSISLTAKDSYSGVAGTEYSVDDGAWQPYSPFSLKAAGLHKIAYRSTDNLGTAEGIRTASVTITSTPPVTDIHVGTPSFKSTDGILFISAATPLTLTAIDEIAGIANSEYRIDKGTWVSYAPFSIDSEGEHLIEFRSINQAGIVEPPRSIALTVDTLPPITTLTLGDQHPDSDSTIYISKQNTVEISANDYLAGVQKTEYRLDGGSWHAYQKPFPLDADKSHTIGLRSKDMVNNQEDEKVITVKVDKVAPKTAITIGTPQLKSAKGVLYVTEMTFFTLTSEDSQSGVSRTEFRIDGSQWQKYAPFTVYGEGEHLIEYRSIDKAGNVEPARSVKVTVDASPPITTAQVDGKSYEPGSSVYGKDNSKITLKASENNTGIKFTEYKLDSGPWTLYAPVAISGEGKHLFEYRSIDLIGNVEPVHFLTIYIDKTPPVSTLSIGNPKKIIDGELHVEGTTVIAPTATDTMSGVARTEYRITGKGEASGTEPFTITTIGRYQIEYWSEDKMGNVEPHKTLTIVVDPPAPPLVATGAARREKSDIPPQETTAPVKEEQPSKTASVQKEEEPQDYFGGKVSPRVAEPPKSKTPQYIALGVFNIILIVGVLLFL